MTKLKLKNILVCPSCHQKIISHAKTCPLKNTTFKIDNIWDFVTSQKKKQRSQMQNELMHQKGSWDRISDGSYEILATFARGNDTVDVACGDGFLEKLSPETVGVDFSLSALQKAQKNGARNLVCASAENLPFANNSFDLAICAGSIENIQNPQKAISEMARVAKIQVMTVHREFDFPGSRTVRRLVTRLLKVPHQPIEKPLKWKELEKMLEVAKLKIVFKGYWTLPVNYGRIIKFLPPLSNIPSCFFVITITKEV